MYHAGRRLDDYTERVLDTFDTHGLANLLDPTLIVSSHEYFRAGKFRDALLNGVTALFDLIRSRSGLDLDGAPLVGRVFSLERPILRIADLRTESGRNEQKGFIQLLQGTYLAVRNPRAHTLKADLDEATSSQQLIFLSWLAARIRAAASSEASRENESES